MRGFLLAVTAMLSGATGANAAIYEIKEKGMVYDAIREGYFFSGVVNGGLADLPYEATWYFDTDNPFATKTPGGWSAFGERGPNNDVSPVWGSFTLGGKTLELPRSRMDYWYNVAFNTDGSSFGGHFASYGGGGSGSDAYGVYEGNRFRANDDGYNLTRTSLSVSAAVPELSTWAMMFVGLFGVGAMLRGRRLHRPVRIGLAAA